MSRLNQFQAHLFDQLQLVLRSHYYVAFSGGKDSTVLLDLMQRLRERVDIQITALHVNHKLHADAQEWETHCANACADFKLPFKSTAVQLANNSEAAARDARYQWFAQQLSKGDVLLTAHHQQDRVETLLFNLTRGAGSSGLSSLKAVRQFDDAQLVRPLLGWSIEEIDDYAQYHGLRWIEDPSNQKMFYSRNKIRHNIIPALSEFRPDAIRNIARAAENLADEASILQAVAKADLAAMRQHPFNIVDGSHALSTQDLQALSKARQANALREWLSDLGHEMPSRAFVTQLIDALNGTPSSKTILQEAGLQIRFYDDFLYLLSDSYVTKQFTAIEWSDTSQKITLYDNQLEVNATQKLEGLFSNEPHSKLMLTTAHQIENPKALAGHSLKLKKWFQGMRVPTWRRKEVAILYLVSGDTQRLITVIDPQLKNDWVQIISASK